MRKTLRASALVLALCGSALAGDINNPPVTTDPNAPRGAQFDDGWLGTATPYTATDDGIDGDIAERLAAAARAVLDSMLALF